MGEHEHETNKLHHIYIKDKIDQAKTRFASRLMYFILVDIFIWICR